MPQKQLQIKDLAFSGKMIKDIDPLTIGDNFQSLINMRYNRTGIEAVSGMSKINTSVINATYTEIRNGFHFIKTIPSSYSYSLCQSWNAGGTISKVYQNQTAIPSVGNFEAVELHGDISGADIGKFSDAPIGTVAYCNNKETLIWGGEEALCNGFVAFDPDDSAVWYDFTESIQNTDDSADNSATLRQSGVGGIDSYTKLMLHLDNNVTDSSDSSHTPVATSITYDAAIKKFGTHSAILNADGDRITVPDHADFDFSGGIFTIDSWLYIDAWNPAGSAITPLYWQRQDANNYTYLGYNNALHYLTFVSVVGGLYTAFLQTANEALTLTTQQHIAIVENGDDYYLFIDGNIVATDTRGRSINFTGNIEIGGTNGGLSCLAHFDEFRVSNGVARWTENFTPFSNAYTTDEDNVGIYIGSLQPIQSFKAYIKTPNTATSTLAVKYWDGSAWVAVTGLVDGTASGGISLAQDGIVSFDDTVNIARKKNVNSQLIYWYQVEISASDLTTTIYHSTIDFSMQKIKNAWDGVYRTCYSAQFYDTVSYMDKTINVLTEDYIAASASTYADLGGMLVAEHFYTGFIERQSGIFLVLGDTNTTAATTMVVKYWNGNAWVAVNNLNDGTSENSISLSKSGLVTWEAVNKREEFKTDLTRESPFYYYQITFDKTLSANAHVDYLVGLPAPEELVGHAFPFEAQERLWLCKDNWAECSATNTFSVFNGYDYTKIYFGDENPLTAGASLYAQYGSNLYNVMVFCKKSETWIVVGNSLATWFKYRASATIGCAAPLTMASIHIDPDAAAGNNLNVAIWQSANDVVMFNGRNPLTIDLGVSEYFNQNSTLVTPINPDMIDRSVGFFDKEKQEYHWCIATGTSTELNVELVYSVIKKGWFEINRGTGKRLHGGFNTIDSNGNTYNYGYNDTGYLWRLENGTDFDGNDIDYTVHFGDMIFAENGAVEDGLESFKLRTRNNATGVIATLYQDTKTAAEYTYASVTLNTSGRRVSDHRFSGPRIPFFSASLKLTGSSSTVAPCFEPINLTFNWFIDKISRS